ncbi:MAG: hypothetical protein AAFV53_15195 [Myxococcota bacterium]
MPPPDAEKMIALLTHSDMAVVRQGLELLQTLNDEALLHALADGNHIDASGQLTPAAWLSRGRRRTRARDRARDQYIALRLLRWSGRLQDVSALRLYRDLTGMLPLTDLGGLRTLTLFNIELADLTTLGVPRTLSALTLDNCAALSSLTGMGRLRKLTLRQCNALTALPDEVAHLHELVIQGCDRLDDLRPLQGAAVQALKLHRDPISLSLVAALPALRTLELSAFRALEDIEAIESCAALTALQLTWRRAPPPTERAAILDHLSALPRLRTLSLMRAAGLGDLSFFRGCDALTAVELWDCEVDDLSGLTTLPALQSIRVSQVQAHTPLRALDGCASLTELHLWRCQMGSLNGIEAFPALSRLTLRKVEIEDLSALHQMAHTLKITFKPAVMAPLLTLCGSPAIEQLSLGGVTFDDFSVLRSLPRLRSLSLAQCQVNDWSALADFPALRHLHLNDMGGITDLTSLPPCPRLQTLRIDGRWLASMNGLEQQIGLEALFFSRTSGHRRLQAMHALPNLAKVTWREPDTSALEALATLPQLKTLELDGIPDPLDLSVLSRCTGLQTLTLAQLSRKTLQPLQPPPALKLLRCLDLNDLSSLSSEAVTSLQMVSCALTSLAGLQNWSDLETLAIIDSCPPGPLNALRHLPRLQTLSLNEDFDRTDLIDIIEAAPQLRELSLSTCGIQTLRGLNRLTALETLRLTDCSHLSDLDALAGCSQLADIELREMPAVALDGLHRTPALRALRLVSDPELIDLRIAAQLEGLEQLAVVHCGLTSLAGLQTNQTLQTLHLIDCVQLQDLSALSQCESLTTLSLQNVNVRDLGALPQNLVALQLTHCWNIGDLMARLHDTAIRTLSVRGCMLPDVDAVQRLADVATLRVEDCWPQSHGSSRI